MVSISDNAKRLLKKYGSRLAVAEAFILGYITASEEPYVDELVSEIFVEVARIRLDAIGSLNSKDIKPVRK